MALERMHRIFGDTQLIGDKGDDFFSQTQEEQARQLGWSEGCPVVERLIKPTDQGGRGADVMTKRYAEVLFWRGYIVDALNTAQREELANALFETTPRRQDEPLGTHDSNWPPIELQTNMIQSPMAYALPRMITECLSFEPATNPEKILVISEHIQRALAQSTSIIEFSVLFLEQFVKEALMQKQTAQAARLLKTLIGIGKFEEENCVHLYQEIFSTLQNKAPITWNFYSALSPADRKSYRLIDSAHIIPR